MLIRVTVTVLALSVGLLPGLRGVLCAPAPLDAWHVVAAPGHTHADPSGAVSHHHDPSTPPHSHVSPHAELDGAVGKDTRSESNPTCCGSKAKNGSEATLNTTRPGRKSLASVATLPARPVFAVRARHLHHPHAGAADERASPFVRTRAPLLI